ncbi:MAG: hypothetical protein ACI9SG_001945 [Maribacter sp.]|jgi:hypothetical protein
MQMQIRNYEKNAPIWKENPQREGAPRLCIFLG